MSRSTQQQKEAEARTALLLATIWQRTLPLLHERLALLDQSAAQALAGSLLPELRADALATAHKLAGSLGMFGHIQASEIAREIEQHLEPVRSLDPTHLSHLVSALRRSLPLEDLRP